MIRTFFSRLRFADRPPWRTVLLGLQAFSADGPAMPTFRPVGSEAGFALIEVLISSVLIAFIAIATFTGFDVSGRATADERAHSQADAIAQQWEERLRGQQTSDIAALSRTFCVNDQGVEVAASTPCPSSVTGSSGTIFTVETTGRFVSDTSGTSSCGEESSSADYIQTTTTVKWPSLGSRPPVSESSIVTPPVSGQLVVQDYNGPNPVPGVEVTAIGPAQAPTSRTLTTGKEGCAIFTTLPAGNYTVGVNQPGYVEKNGNQSYSQLTTLTDGATTPVSIAYDRAGILQAKYATEGVSPLKSTGDTFMAVNTTMTEQPGFGEEVGKYSPVPPEPPAPIVSPKSIFPFYYSEKPPATYSYTLYAGGCTSNDPAGWGVPTSDKPVDVAPGATAAPVTLDLPPVTMRLQEGIKAIATGKGTVTELEEGLPAKIITPTTGPHCGAQAKRTFSSTPAGALPHPGMPFGRYKLCVWANVGSPPATARRYEKTFNNSSLAGEALGAIDLTGAGSSPGECPP
jgi:Tfp pilus assembly protein PilX